MLCGLHAGHARDITNLCLSQQATNYMGFLELKNKCFFKRGCFGCSEISWCSDWHEVVILFPLHLMPVLTLCRTPLFALCCKKQQQQKTPCAHQYTSSLVIA